MKNIEKGEMKVVVVVTGIIKNKDLGTEVVALALKEARIIVKVNKVIVLIHLVHILNLVHQIPHIKGIIILKNIRNIKMKNIINNNNKL